MILKNHIATRFLTDENFMWEMMETFKEQNSGVELTTETVTEEDAVLYQFIKPNDQRAYYVTWTVLDKLDMLKVYKKQDPDGSEHYDWTVFAELPIGKKYTLIFPDNKLLRVWVTDDKLCFCHLQFDLDKNDPLKIRGHAAWVVFYVNRFTGKQCDHWNHIDVKKIEEFVYKLMCFMFLSENEEIIVEPGRKHGTKKSGKLINTLPMNITIVNSRWNITSIRTEGFDVSGHFRLQPVGEGRKRTKMIFIAPFQKHGYIRKAKVLDEIPK